MLIDLAFKQMLALPLAPIAAQITAQTFRDATIMESRTARLTVLIDPRKKAAFEELCDREDITPSQKIRQFIRNYLEQELGDDWMEQVFKNNN